ncbi:MAG: hypothetical protein ABGX27_05125 [Desulfurobacteriaceae bacterium]
MKRTRTTLKLLLGLTTIIALNSSSWAVEDESLVQSDETQKKYERKAVLGLDLGLPKRDLQVPVTYCPPRGRCQSRGTWYYTIDQNLENEIAKELYDWLITQRFDKVVITPSKAYIITAKEKIGVDNNVMKTFSFDTGNYEDFKASLENYLNEDLSPVVEKLMSSALEQRYQELPETEQETFITEKAKELGIPVEVAKKLMNSAFVFGVYFEPVNPSATYSTQKIRTSRGYKIVYPTTIEVPSKVKVIIFKFDADKGKFVLYKELDGSSGLGTGESYTYDHRPTNTETEFLFKRSILTSAKATGINVNTTLKEDDNFAIFATVDDVNGTTVKADIGVLEDLRVDAPYLVRENIDGKIETVGFVKARKVFVNCDERGESEFQLIKGKAELKDQLKEHPWTGLFIYTRVGMENYEVTKFDDEDLSAGGGMFTVVKLGATLDLGYAVNSPLLSEIWFDVNFGLGFGGDALQFEGNGSAFTDDPSYLTLGLGLYKRFYIRNFGLYLAPGAEFALEGLSAKGNQTYLLYDGEDISVSSFAIKPQVQFGYNFSPNFEIAGYLGWNQPLSTSAKRGDVDVDAEVSGGLTFGVGINYHIKTVGPFVKLYKKPSTVCRMKVEKTK